MTKSARPSDDDISYVRQLAESGARAPLIGGRFMAWWGLLVAAAWTAQYLAANGFIGDGRTIYGIIWVSFGAVGAEVRPLGAPELHDLEVVVVLGQQGLEGLGEERLPVAHRETHGDTGHEIKLAADGRANVAFPWTGLPR